jgi:hypothetical protein
MRSDTTSFADLLRQSTTSAALSQEELATHTGVSLHGVSDRERVVRGTPHLGDTTGSYQQCEDWRRQGLWNS